MTKVVFILLLGLIQLSYADESMFSKAMNHTSIKKWNEKAQRDSSRALAMSESKRLSFYKKEVLQACKQDEICLYSLAHFYSYHYFRVILEKKMGDKYIPSLSLLMNEQKEITRKCDSDNCRVNVISSFCALKDKTSMFSAPFCQATFFTISAQNLAKTQ